MPHGCVSWKASPPRRLAAATAAAYHTSAIRAKNVDFGCPSPKLRSAGKSLICQLRPGDNLGSMITVLLTRLRLLPFLFGGHRQLALENLALRQQLAVYKRTATRPKLHPTDRPFWVGLAKVWAGWRQPLV